MTGPRYVGAFVSMVAFVAASIGFTGLFPARTKAQTGPLSPTFLVSQANAGKAIYGEQCSSCHGSNLDNGEFGPPLSGEEFLQKWGNRHVDEVFDFISRMMPPAAHGSLSPDQTTNLIAYLLQRNAVAISDKPLPSDVEALKNIVMPTPTNGSNGGLANGVALPPPPNAVPNPFDHFTPVTEAMLGSPAPGDWLTWRRDAQVGGFSPLSQINKGNVDRLRVAW